MNQALLELFPELVALLFFGVGSVVLSVAGVLIERMAIQTVAGGELALGAWMAFFGLAVLYFGVYAFGYTELRTRLADVLGRESA